ncbi:MAG: choice-of-anchor D domain-containing protein [Candidatus Eisenbacteria bacterium]|nr:choice-of-anchor D domain-containing protein [Candidatus Eisenbacteria bacterium]
MTVAPAVSIDAPHYLWYHRRCSMGARPQRPAFLYPPLTGGVMRSPTRIVLALLLGIVLLCVQGEGVRAETIRVCTYNILNFPGSTGTAREPDFRTVLSNADPDVLVVQEMLSQSGVNQFLNNILNDGQPGTYAAAPFVNGYDTDNALFYKPDVVSFVSTQQIPTALRDISEYVLRPVDHTSSAAEFRVYSLHLKAGSSSSDQTKRLAEATILRNHLNALPADSHFILGADLNIRSSSESAYQKLVGSEADNDGRSFDPIDTPGSWYSNSAFAAVHTQSPRTTQFGGGANGGMDDRFDQLLVSAVCEDGEGFDIIDGTYTAYGNDGLHFNIAINQGTNYAVGNTIADAIHDAADHLPVFADFQTFSLLFAPDALDLGTAIVGASVSADLSVANLATPPADDLDYSLAAPSGFSTSAGPFSLPAGASDDHPVSMVTGTTGERSGTLEIATDDPDAPLHTVALGGLVVDNATPSLDAVTQLLSDTLDLGLVELESVAAGTVSVWNLDYAPATNAALSVCAGTITGSGRFSFEGGFSPSLVGSSPAEYGIAFDTSGATPGSLYVATLTFEAADDSSVQGAGALADLTVQLSALASDGTGVPGHSTGFSLAAASRNPFSDRTSLLLTLPRPAGVDVAVYSIQGRRVTTLASDTLPGGEHVLTWDGRDGSGTRCASGVYVVRAQADGTSLTTKVLLLR